MIVKSYNIRRKQPLSEVTFKKTKQRRILFGDTVFSRLNVSSEETQGLKGNKPIKRLRYNTLRYICNIHGCQEKPRYSVHSYLLAAAGSSLQLVMPNEIVGLLPWSPTELPATNFAWFVPSTGARIFLGLEYPYTTSQLGKSLYKVFLVLGTSIILWL